MSFYVSPSALADPSHGRTPVFASCSSTKLQSWMRRRSKPTFVILVVLDQFEAVHTTGAVTNTVTNTVTEMIAFPKCTFPMTITRAHFAQASQEALEYNDVTDLIRRMVRYDPSQDADVLELSVRSPGALASV